MRFRVKLLAQERRWERAALLFVILTSLLRLLLLARLELAPDEAYYWDWSRHLSWGYYDQGPLIAYVIRLTTFLFGINEFGVRVGVWAAAAGTLLCAYALARRVFSPLAGLLTVVLLAATPLMAVGSLIATYDPLLVFFWALTLALLERALFGETDAEQRRAWLFAGLTTGLGFLSKHTMLLILPCLLLFLLLSPPHRKWLRRPEPYAAFLLTLLLYGGVFWWNAQHHWWTFGHLLFLAHKSSGSPLLRLGEFLGSQALLLGPGLFLACLYVGVRVFRCSGVRVFRCWVLGVGCWVLGSARSKLQQNVSLDSLQENGSQSASVISTPKHLNTQTPEHPTPNTQHLNTQHLFLFCLGFPILLFFCLMAFRAKVQANWAPCAWLTPAILWAGWAAERLEAEKRRRGEEETEAGNSVGTLLAAPNTQHPTPNTQHPTPERLILSVVGTSALLTVLLLLPGLRQGVGIRLKPKDDVTTQMAGWGDLAARVQQVRQEMGRDGRKVFLAGNGYQYCALMAFYLPDHPPTYDMYLHYRLTMYAARVEGLRAHLGEDAIFLNDGEADDRDLHAVFQRVEWDPPFPIWQRPLHAEPVRFVHIARCYGYRRYTGIKWAVGG